MQCAVRGGGPQSQNVLVYNYPVEGAADPIRRALRVYGVIEDIKFCHWTHMPSVGDGVRIVCVVRRDAILYHMSISEVNVKIAYAGQQQVCDLCNAPCHIARGYPYRNKCLQCGLEGHFSRDCPQRDSYRDSYSVPDPTPAAAVAAAAAPSDFNDTLLRDDADSLDGLSVASAVGVCVTGPAIDSLLYADIVSSDSGWGLGTVVWTARLLLSGGLSSLKSWVFFLVPWLHRRTTGGHVSLLWSMSCSCGVKGPFLIVRKLLLLMHWLCLVWYVASLVHMPLSVLCELTQLF